MMMAQLFLSLSLLLIAYSNGFSFQQKRSSRLPSLSMKQIVVFGPNNLRVHDNPCLLHNKDNSIIPVIFSPYKDIGLQQAANNLQIKLQAMGGNALHFDGNDPHSDFFLFVKQLSEDQSEKEEISVIYSQSAVEPAASSIRKMISSLAMLKGVQCVELWDEIVTFEEGDSTTMDVTIYILVYM
jgi:deoxyribodipyrimidine photolyase